VIDQVSHPALNLRISPPPEALRQPSSKTIRDAVSKFMTTDQLHSGGTVSAAALFIGALHLLLLQPSAELPAPTALPHSNVDNVISTKFPQLLLDQPV
jgi:hypothetical protein